MRKSNGEIDQAGITTVKRKWFSARRRGVFTYINNLHTTNEYPREEVNVMTEFYGGQIGCIITNKVNIGCGSRVVQSTCEFRLYDVQ
jgi:hypothetical protein